MDSNHRYRMKKQPFLAARARSRNSPSATKTGSFVPGPMVRIHLTPAESRVRTCPTRLRGRSFGARDIRTRVASDLTSNHREADAGPIEGTVRGRARSRGPDPINHPTPGLPRCSIHAGFS